MSEEVKSFLDEGYDFIEESFSSEPLSYTEADKYEITEAEGKASPYKILGRCCGNFQPIGVQSRNQRVYENDHWDVQLHKPEVSERLKSRSMWGTLGHFDRKITDEDVREGRISHVISVLETRRDNNGKPYLYGELEILDTPAGRILEAMYKGGANLYVSSRGAGKLINVAGDPLKHVDKNSFYFEGFDIVKAPGFLQARPVFEATKNESVSEGEMGARVSDVENKDMVEKIAEHMETLPESEIAELKGQINQLAKIIEKVVDDVYEEEIDETSDKKVEAAFDERVKRHEKTSEKNDKDWWNAVNKNNREEAMKIAQKDKEEGEAFDKKLAVYDKWIQNRKKKNSSESLAKFVELMADSNISEQAFEEILDMIKGDLK